MASTDPLLIAATEYITERWTADDWREFARRTGTTDIVVGHDRLLRSLGFDDTDYPAVASNVLKQVVSESVEPRSGEAGRMKVFAASLPDLPEWVRANAPTRVKKLFAQYLAARVASELPDEWRDAADGDVPSQDPQQNDGLRATRIQTSLPTAPPTVQIRTPFDTSKKAPVQPAVASPFPTPTAAAEPAAIPALSRGKGDIFIVHGHDISGMDSIRIYVQQRTGILPVSLAEEPGKGLTIIEKFEKHGSKASYVIVLMSPDDVGQSNADAIAGEAPAPRARQNVVLELGYFYAALGRDKVLVMDGGVERPSDLAGVAYIKYPGLNWKDALRDELEEAGLTN